jgi:hypothetical protein
VDRRALGANRGLDLAVLTFSLNGQQLVLLPIYLARRIICSALEPGALNGVTASRDLILHLAQRLYRWRSWGILLLLGLDLGEGGRAGEELVIGVGKIWRGE